MLGPHFLKGREACEQQGILEGKSHAHRSDDVCRAGGFALSFCPVGFFWVPWTILQDTEVRLTLFCGTCLGRRADLDSVLYLIAFQFPGLCSLSKQGEQLLCDVHEEKQFEQALALLALKSSAQHCLSPHGVGDEGLKQEVCLRPELWQLCLALLLFSAEMTGSVKAKYSLEAKSEHFR